ncbi:hypothetical protein J7J84_04550 [bacterium]|nr:hypothetical protein [bacterium]
MVKKRFNPSAASLMVIYLLLLLLVTTSCGGGGEGSVARGLRAPEASFSPGSSPADKTSPAFCAGLDCRVDVSLDDALAELDALETPEGVDAALFAELKGALAKALMDNPPARRGSLVPQGEEPGPAHGVRKFVSTVPTDGGNSVELVVTDEGGPHLVWSEINLGDYDMNSVVSIADITPLAMFYGDVEGGPEWDAWHEAVDGSGEGSIGIEDITPIAAHFGVSVVGYRVMRHPDGAGGWELLDEIERPYDPSQSGQPKERPEYAFDDPSPLADAYYAVQPTDGDYNYGISSNVASFGSPAGSAPDPPPVESGEPGPDELVLSLGEVAMLDEITSEESFTLRTGSEQEYLLVLTSPNEVEEGSDPEDDFQVAVSYTASGASSVSVLPPAANRRWTPPVQPSFMPDRAEQERQITERYGRLPGTGAKHTAAVGDTREFDIVYINGNMSDVDDTITARCTNAGSLADIWVDLTVDDGRISQAQLDDLAGWLDSRIVGPEVATYGAFMDPDEDGKILVLLTSTINEIPGLVGGMFVANDLQPAVQGSNSADIVYCQVPDATGEFDAGSPIPEADFLDAYISIPAHELQHLINFSNRLRLYQEGEPEDPFVGEEVWLNEALSHFTEDWTGFEPLNNFVSPDNYLTASPWVSLPGGNTWNPSIFRRGAGYLLMRYLTDRFGEGVLPELLQRDATGLPLYGWGNVQAATGEDLTTLLLRNGVAMYAAGLGLNTSSQFSYGDVSIDAETGAQHGVRFRGWNESFTGGEYSITEPLAYVLSSGGPASRTFTARENALLFIRLLPSEESSCRITVTPVGGKPIRAAVARIDSGEVIAEGEAGNLAGGGLVLGELSSAEEVDSYAVTISEPAPYVFRVVALTADIEDFTFSINGSAKPNHALDPVTMSYGPPGVYQLRANLTTSGTYDIDIASPDGAGAYYLLVLPY